MEIINFDNFLRGNYLITISIILYVFAHFPSIYNMYKNKNIKYKNKNQYYYLLILAFILLFIHSIYVKHYEIAFFCIIKIIIDLLIIGTRMLYS